MNSYKDKFLAIVKGRVAVFIDAANLEMSMKDLYVNPRDIPDTLGKYAADNLAWRVSYKKLKQFIESAGTTTRAAFYSMRFDHDNHDKFLSVIKRSGFKLITKPLKEYQDHTPEAPHRKANFDVEIAVAATFSQEAFDTFVLFSGDCDFEYLLRHLRGHGKRCIVFSRAGHISKELLAAASQYFDVIDFRDVFLEVFPKKAKSPTSFDARPRS